MNKTLLSCFLYLLLWRNDDFIAGYSFKRPLQLMSSLAAKKLTASTLNPPAFEFCKLKSLSPRTLYVWKVLDNNTTDFSQPLLVLETGGNAIVNHRAHSYVYSAEPYAEGKVPVVIGSIEPRLDEERLYFLLDDDNNPPPQELLKTTARELEFSKQYTKKNGYFWNHYFDENGPRSPPVMHLHAADHVGQKHSVTSSAGLWHECQDNPLNPFKQNPKVDLELEVVSTSPIIFVIKNFLSDLETKLLIESAAAHLAPSEVGSDFLAATQADPARTSRNTWLERETNFVTDAIYRRAAALLNVSESVLHHHACAEALQVVHYNQHQKYDFHFDWVVGSSHPDSRCATLLMYLSDQADEHAGGETAFPFASPTRGSGASGDDDVFKLHPGRGSAVLFYNLLPDGNGDLMSLHAGLPVLKGEKWLANLWVWDPFLPEDYWYHLKYRTRT